MLRTVFCLFQFLTVCFAPQYSCKDEDDNPVDWYVMYKLPQIKGSNNRLVEQGEAYAYMTADDNDKGWKISKKSINSKDSLPGLTLKPLYDKEKGVFYVLYNDQQPSGKTISRRGHAKGVVVGASDGGFWLVHSVPRFVPSPRDHDYFYPKNGLRNGQSFLCMNAYRDNLNDIGRLLIINEVNTYDGQTPSGDLKTLLPYLAQLVEHTGSIKKLSDVAKLSSPGDQEFRAFAKQSKYGEELYTDLVAPELEVNLAVQTWPNDRTHQGSSCSRRAYNVENIEEINVAGVDFTSTKDHSKWAVSEEDIHPWVCVGDINKDDAQEHRGGGTVCIKHKNVWKAYYDSIVELDSCYRKKRTYQDQIGKSPVEVYAPLWQPSSGKAIIQRPSSQGLSRFFNIIGPLGF